jgi:flagellar assembly protein FliH
MRIQRYDSLKLRDFRLPYIELRQETEIAPIEIPPPTPTFSLEEMQAAKASAEKKGYEEGIAAGLAQAATEQAKRNDATRAVMEQMGHEFQMLRAGYDALLAQQGKEVSQLVFTIARQIAGDALDRRSHLMIEAMIARCLPSVLLKPRVVVEVHPDMLDQVQGQIITLFREASYDGDFVVRAGAQIAKHDLRVDWLSGYAERNTEALWQEVDRLLKEVSIELTTKQEPPSPTH